MSITVIICGALLLIAFAFSVLWAACGVAGRADDEMN